MPPLGGDQITFPREGGVLVVQQTSRCRRAGAARRATTSIPPLLYRSRSDIRGLISRTPCTGQRLIGPAGLKPATPLTCRSPHRGGDLAEYAWQQPSGRERRRRSSARGQLGGIRGVGAAVGAHDSVGPDHGVPARSRHQAHRPPAVRPGTIGQHANGHRRPPAPGIGHVISPARWHPLTPRRRVRSRRAQPVSGTDPETRLS